MTIKIEDNNPVRVEDFTARLNAIEVRIANLEYFVNTTNTLDYHAYLRASQLSNAAMLDYRYARSQADWKDQTNGMMIRARTHHLSSEDRMTGLEQRFNTMVLSMKSFHNVLLNGHLCKTIEVRSSATYPICSISSVIKSATSAKSCYESFALSHMKLLTNSA